jgi:hypothetical protein
MRILASGEYKNESSLDRFFSWIESCKKAFLKYEIKETSYENVMLIAIIRLNQVLE